MQVAYRAPGFPEVIAAPGSSSFSRGFDNVGAELGSIDRLTPAPLTGINRIAEKFVGRRGVLFAATIATAAAAAASLVGGVNKAEARGGSPKVGAEISAVNSGFETDDPKFSALRSLILGRSFADKPESKPQSKSARNSSSSNTLGQTTLVKRQASDLSGPQVQFFNVVASDNPQTTVNLNTRTFIAGLQNYAKNRGEGLRVRIAQKDGQYDIPLIRVNMTQAEIVNSAYKDGKAVIDILSATIKDLGYPTKDRVNLALLEGNTGGSCFLLPIGAPNPGNVQTLSISTKDATCNTSNSEVGFSGLNVEAAQGIIWIPRIGNFVRDPLDTMSDNSINGNSRNWAWWETKFNHSNTYGASLNNSSYFQHHLQIQTSGSGSGDVTKSPAADPCQEDCGSGLLYPAGTRVVLKAEPKSGNKFTGWENCPSGSSSNTCEVPMDAERNVAANFTLEQTTTTPTTPKPPKTSTLVARVIKSKKLGSKIEKFDGNGTIVLAGKEGKTRTYTTNKIGQLVMLRLRPAKGSFISYVEGCDKPPAHRDNPTNTKRCYVYMRTVDKPSTPKKEVETVEVGYKKTKPKPEK